MTDQLYTSSSSSKTISHTLSASWRFDQYVYSDSSCIVRVQSANIDRKREFRGISLSECRINLETLMEEVKGEEKSLLK
jgi:hypothetical protein